MMDVAQELLDDVERDAGIKINAETRRGVAEKMMRFFERSRRVKRSSNSRADGFPDYDIIFREGAIGRIKDIKGWKSDAEMARELGLSKAYISGLKNQKFGVTATVISRIAVITGNIDKNWHIFYELKFTGFRKSTDPKWNEAKSRGEMPCSWTSVIAPIRSEDHGNGVEQEIAPHFSEYEKKLDNRL